MRCAKLSLFLFLILSEESPERCGHEGLFHLIIHHQIPNLASVEKHHFEILGTVKMLRADFFTPFATKQCEMLFVVLEFPETDMISFHSPSP